MELQSSFIPIDTFTCNALLADPWTGPLPAGGEVPSPAAGQAAPPRGASPEPADAWSDGFTRTLQSQHVRVREFLFQQRDRWRRATAHFTRQAETLQAEVRALQAANEGLRAELLARPAGENASAVAAAASQTCLAAMDEVRGLKARNAELQRQLLELRAAPAGAAAAAPRADSGPWEAQKRRFLAELESDAPQDAEAAAERSKIEDVIARTDKIVADKNREIEELQYLLSNQSNSLGALAVGAAALGQVLDQDAIIREERERLQQLQEDCRQKLRQAEIELAMERARLARRDAEIEEKLQSAEARRGAVQPDAEALAPTGRSVRGRWRTQMGLTDDDPPDGDRGRR